MQLATALAANTVLLASGLSALTFTAASDLIAAHAEGLAADDPNLHP